MKETTNPPEPPVEPKPQQHWYLIRGLIRESGHWGEFPPLLQAGIPGSRVHCLDLPGTGVHFQKKSPTTLAATVKEMRREFLKHEDGLRERWGEPLAPRYVLALSLGAMLALKWIALHRKDFAAAVLINTSLPSISPFYERMQPNAALEGLKAVLKESTEERERAILKITSNRPCRRAKALPEWVAIQENHPVSRENLVRQLLAALTVGVPRVPRDFPVLLLNSAGDRIVDPVCSLRLHRKWKWDLRRHPSAGHDLTLDDPEWVVRTVRHWVNEAKHGSPIRMPGETVYEGNHTT